MVFGISASVFWRTAYPTITWWDSSEYTLAAATLGVISAPGSLLLTLLGWPLAHLPGISSPAYVLNLFAGALAAVATVLVYAVALRVLRPRDDKGSDAAVSTPVAIGAGLAALTFAFSDTPWDHAIRFNPYVLSAVFTGLILWTMVRWWSEADRPESWRWIAVLGLLFGLDFSVHRTNALLIPGALVWILLRSPRTLRQPRVWARGAAGLVAGLAVQLLVIPIAAFSDSPLNFSDPSNWSRFWDFISLRSRGGAFLLNLFPRKADFWSVQVYDFLRVLGANFLHWTGPTKVFGVLPALAALFGLSVLWRRDRRLGIAYTVLLFLQAAATVLYFNIPANYFRTFDRHYLPVCVTIAVLVACGLGTASAWAADLMKGRRRVVAGMLTAAIVAVPAAQLLNNGRARDASNRYFAKDYAANALQSLPPNAIYFTVGDNDTFPVMYLQAVEGVRRDVEIINLSVASMPRHAELLRRREPSFPLALGSTERAALGSRVWPDTTIVIPVTGTAEHFGLAAGAKIPASIPFSVRPAFGTRMAAADMTVLDIVRTNRWNRPLTFAITGTQSAMGWLAPYGRLDGLFYRVVPTRDPPLDLQVLRSNLLEHSEYRGYADRSVRIDTESRTMGYQSLVAMKELLDAEQARGETDRCRADAKKFFTALPLERLALPADIQEGLAPGCKVAP